MATEQSDASSDFDVLVIGGGVNGTGLARDLALRGLRVALVERTDLAFGASGNSSGMIHGGPRYMLKTPEVTRTSCLDSGYVQQIAPHLIFRIPFLVPVFGTRPRDRLQLDLVEGFFRAYDDFQPLKRGKPHTRLTPEEALAVVPGLNARDLVGAVTFDEWGIDGARLCVANALDAREHGATVLLHTSAEALLFEREGPPGERGAVRGALVRDRLTGEARELRARCTVNATGAWAPVTGALAGVSEEVRVRPGKGVHVVLDRRLTDVAVMATAIDGRQIFLEPWENTTVLGTTDDDEYGDLDALEPLTSEVRYLLEGCESVLPEVGRSRVIGTTVGARPTIYAWGVNEDALSREHALVDHGPHGAPELFSLIGGKLASYRLFAQEVADVLATRLGCSKPCTTHTAPLPGGDKTPDLRGLAARFGVPSYAVRRLVSRHGARAERVLELASTMRGGLDIVCGSEPVLACEVRYAVEVEGARTLLDVARRTRLGVGPCGGLECALPGAVLAGEALGWDARRMRAEAAALLRDRRRLRAPGVSQQQARFEPAAAAALASVEGRSW